MKVQESNNEVQSKGDSMSREAGTFRVIVSDGEKILLHAPKAKRFVGKMQDFNEVLKKENASGTGYLCDDDDGRDEEFQNG